MNLKLNSLRCRGIIIFQKLLFIEAKKKIDPSSIYKFAVQYTHTYTLARLQQNPPDINQSTCTRRAIYIHTHTTANKCPEAIYSIHYNTLEKNKSLAITISSCLHN